MGSDHQMPGNVRFDVSVDPTPLREHMKKVHGIGVVAHTDEEEQ